MSTTYATNAEVRLSYPQIDNILPATRINGAQSGATTALTSLVVDSAIVFPKTGTIEVLNSSGTQESLAYNSRSETLFYLATSTSASFLDNERVQICDTMLDGYRDLAKAWVDASLTNPNVPSNFRKDLEIGRVFYLASQSNQNSDVRAWGKEVQDGMNTVIGQLVRQYPGVIRQTIAKLVEEDLDSNEILALKTGPNGDQ